MVIVVSKRKHTMLHILAVIAFLSIALNVKMFIDVKNYQAAYNSTVGAIQYLADQVRNVTNEKDKLEQSIVKSQAKAKFFTAEVDCLARNIYYEAGREPVAGKIAVGMVVLNRMASPMFPKTACGVVYQGTHDEAKGCQFSWACQDGLPGIVMGSEAWNLSIRIAKQILIKGKDVGDTSRGALYFHNDTVKPSWATKDKFLTQIGGHFFYR